MTTAGFRKAFQALPSGIREQANGSYRLWLANPHHPSLHFKRIHPVQPIYSARIGLHYRAVALVEGQVAIWYWIGTHADFDKWVKTL